jgi:signal transduction histidine kinase
MFLDVASAGAYGELTETDRHDISTAEDSVKRLTALVNKVLDMESGQLTLCCDITSLNPLLERALRAVSPWDRLA